MKFRVWCLSWDDTESEGRDVVSYDPITGKPIPRKGEIGASFLSSPGDAAEAYADWAHDNRDGHEDRWPLKFRVRSEDGTVQDFDVEREFVTEFSARAVKP